MPSLTENQDNSENSIFKTHQINYSYKLNNNNTLQKFKPTTKITKTENTIPLVSTQKLNDTTLQLLSEIFTQKLNQKYNNNITDYLYNEKIHKIPITGKREKVSLFDDLSDEEERNEELKEKNNLLFSEDEEEDGILSKKKNETKEMIFSDESEISEEDDEDEESKEEKKRKFGYLENSDDEEKENLSKFIVGDNYEGVNNEEDESKLINEKAKEIKLQLENTKVTKTSNKKKKTMSEKRKINNELQKINKIQKEKKKESK
ncbi:hypothetical protein ABK040_013765 [Willaertia magna]